MHAPTDMPLKEIRVARKLYIKIINHMMRNKYDRDSLFNHEKFKVFLVEVLGFKTTEKVYNYLIFRHYYLMEDIDKLVSGNLIV